MLLFSIKCAQYCAWKLICQRVRQIYANCSIQLLTLMCVGRRRQKRSWKCKKKIKHNLICANLNSKQQQFLSKTEKLKQCWIAVEIVVGSKCTESFSSLNVWQFLLPLHGKSSHQSQLTSTIALWSLFYLSCFVLQHYLPDHLTTFHLSR